MAGAYEALRERLRTISNIGKAGAVLGWDQNTYMPPEGVHARGEQMATLARLGHEMFTAAETGELLNAAAEELSDLPYDSDDASIIRITRRDYERQQRVPAPFVAEMRRHGSESRQVWVEARRTDDFPSFKPFLQNTVRLSRELAGYYGYEERPYDALINVAEPGLKTTDLERIFGDLKREQTPLIKEIAEREQVDDSVLHQPFDEAKQEAFGRMVVERYGYDFNRGRLDRTTHPFEIALAIDDVRLTTRYDPNFLSMSLFGTMHESGHGMYEQGVGRGLEGTPVARGASGGFHESQSRLWENLVGRSRPFWEAFYPELQKTFPEQLGGASLDTFYRAVNKVYPSLIRVEADELTYNMHIMLRFELENELLEERLSVQDAPEAWRRKMDEYLGVTPPNDRLGILQDTHWATGLGGFPNYALGNVFGAQIWEKAVGDNPGIPDEIGQGQFETLLHWLQDNLYVHGRKFETKELMERVTGKPISTEPYIRYLRGKFGEIYGRLS
ncbi:MAG TPA: carboxypeptidase M32 [Chloroflexota bacterium]|nr:carboxypeptidase M32 [Chloroflexota bacterium]